MNTRGFGVVYGSSLATGRVKSWNTSAVPPVIAPPTYDELARHQAAAAVASDNGSAAQRSDPTEGQHDGNGAVATAHEGNGTNGQRATSRQIDYACVLARQIRGLGIRRLDSLSDAVFGKPMAELTSNEASQLITALKDIRAGKTELVAVLEGGAL